MTFSLSSAPNSSRESPSAISKSSFFFGMRILPKNQRKAMYQVYAFCRSVDDIADSKSSTGARLNDLTQWRRQIQDLYGSDREGNLTQGLLQIIKEYQLKEEDFMSVIDGMEMDIKTINQIPDWSSLDKYCDCVASAVGRLSSKIFGIDEQSGVLLSHHLGRALQLTNILRDIDEDAEMGRFYFPIEELHKQKIFEKNIQKIISHKAFGKVCETVVAASLSHFKEADKIMSSLDRPLVKSPRIMSFVYKALLKKLSKRGWSKPRKRISTPKGYILLSIIKYGVI